MRAVPSGTVLNLRTTALQKCGAVPRRARISGLSTLCITVSLNSRLESNKGEEEVQGLGLRVYPSLSTPSTLAFSVNNKLTI